MQLFYIPDIKKDTPLSLSKDESRHIAKSLRLKEGDEIHLTDGKGSLYKAEVIDPSVKKAKVKVVEEQKNYGKRNYTVHVAAAPTKNMSRYEWFLEKATEIGIDEITPLICHNSERNKIRKDRLERVMIAAMKQSLKTYLPNINSLTDAELFVNKVSTPNKFIAHCYDDNLPHLKNVYKPGEDAVILIGPEGDFSKKEVEQAEKAGFKSISLGKSRLRSETAGVIACTMINMLNE